jgi:protein-disulfide isomerase
MTALSFAAGQLVAPVSSRDHQLGEPTAPLTLVEYADFECSYCGGAYHVVKALERQLGRRLRVVFRHFPLAVVHPHAELAAEAAEAAAAQRQFWRMHALLFEHQTALDGQALTNYAAALGLDLARFTRELRERVHAAHVQEDFMGGVRSGANGTPTFFINGTRHDGPYDFENLLAALENAAPSAMQEKMDEERRPSPKSP